MTSERSLVQPREGLININYITNSWYNPVSDPTGSTYHYWTHFCATISAIVNFNASMPPSGWTVLIVCTIGSNVSPCFELEIWKTERMDSCRVLSGVKSHLVRRIYEWLIRYANVSEWEGYCYLVRKCSFVQEVHHL